MQGILKRGPLIAFNFFEHFHLLFKTDDYKISSLLKKPKKYAFAISFFT